MNRNKRYYDVAERDKILGDLTKNVGRHNCDFARHNFGGDDFQATWPDTELSLHSYCILPSIMCPMLRATTMDSFNLPTY